MARRTTPRFEAPVQRPGEARRPKAPAARPHRAAAERHSEAGRTQTDPDGRLFSSTMVLDALVDELNAPVRH